MNKLGVNEIMEVAKEIIKSNEGGIRFIELLREIEKRSPKTPRPTIEGSINKLIENFPKEIYKPSRGLFEWVVTENQKSEPASSKEEKKESAYYEPFAKWLIAHDEVTVAIPLGGNKAQGKWSTPDVLGVIKKGALDIVDIQLEIVSAEVKINPKDSFNAFGQAIAYRLFSSKSYIAMPSNFTGDDRERLESLCLLYGVGLVIFDLDSNPNDVDFNFIIRAQHFSPDMYYVNVLARRLRDNHPDIFSKLFGQ